MALRVELKFEGYTLEIPANPYPMYPWKERLNYISIDSATGERHVFNFDDGPTRVNSVISWKAIHYDKVKEYEDFIFNKIKFGLHPFEIVCPDYIDFGKGMGENIPSAYFAGSTDLKDIITPRDDAGLYYDIELPYMYVKKKG